MQAIGSTPAGMLIQRLINSNPLDNSMNPRIPFERAG